MQILSDFENLTGFLPTDYQRCHMAVIRKFNGTQTKADYADSGVQKRPATIRAF
jgi:hypothetical protein